MRSGGGSQYDMVSASGDASLRLIYGKDVQAVDPSKIPDFKNFGKAFQSPPNNTVGGKHYGISLQWGPNILLYNTKKVKPAPTSWSSIYTPEVQGQDHRSGQPDPDRRRGAVPDEDAAVARDQGSVRAELDSVQRDDQPAEAAEAARSRSTGRRAVRRSATSRTANVVIGAAWPYQLSQLLAAKAPVKDTIPKEGATGWLDTWMVSAHTKNLDCAYKWLAYISTPKVQAKQATYYGETPVNSKACPIMDKLSKGSCAQYHANAPLKYFKQIYFWKTPLADCGNGKKDCMDYTKWQQAWTQLKG